MIVSLRGVFRGRTNDGIVVDVDGVGYEVVLPPIVEQALGELSDGSPLDLRIAYHATRDQPVPVLYGFTRDEEKRFWELLKSAPEPVSSRCSFAAWRRGLTVCCSIELSSRGASIGIFSGRRNPRPQRLPPFPTGFPS